MVRPFTFAVQLGPFDDPVALRSHARKVEDLGYGALYSADHIGSVDPFLPLMVAAEATTTLRFGPLVLNNEFHNPVLLARQAASFDRLSGGRLILGMGSGYMQAEHDAADIELRSPGPRVTRFGESIAALRDLLDSGSAHLDGKHIRISVDDLGVRPAQAHVPILIGGNGPRMVATAGRLADIFQFTGLTHDPATGAPSAGSFTLEDVERRAGWLTEAAGERDGDIVRSALVQAVDTSSGWRDARRAVSERTGVVEDVFDATPFALYGEVPAVVDKLEALRDRFGISDWVIREVDAFASVIASLT